MTQHHFVVVYDSETETFSVDYEALARFPDGTIWVFDATHPDGGKWVKSDDSTSDEKLTELSKVDAYATGSLIGMIMLRNDHYQLPGFPHREGFRPRN